MTCTSCGHACFWLGAIPADDYGLRMFDVWECRAFCTSTVVLERPQRPKPPTEPGTDGEPVRECTVPQSRGKYKEREWQGLGVQHEH